MNDHTVPFGPVKTRVLGDPLSSAVNQPGVAINRFAGAEQLMDWAFVHYKFLPNDMLLLLLVRWHSFKLGRHYARFRRDFQLGEATGIGFKKIGAVKKRLVTMRVVNIEQVIGGDEVWTINPRISDWKIKRRFKLTPELQELDRLLSSLVIDPKVDYQDPNQPLLIERERSFLEVLRESIAENLPTRVAGVTASSIRQDRSVSTDGPEQQGGSSESAGSVVGVRPHPAAELAAPSSWVAEQKLPEKGSSTDTTAKTPRKGDSPKRGVLDETRHPEKLPEKGSSGENANVSAGQNDSPKWGVLAELAEKGSSPDSVLPVLSVLDVSGVLVPLKGTKTVKHLNTEGQDPEKLPEKGSSTEPPTSAPGALVTYDAEDEFVRDYEQWLGKKAAEGWGGFWRERLRLYPKAVHYALNELKVRLDNPKPVPSRGGLMRFYYRQSLQIHYPEAPLEAR
jgi:hypothetical protein